VTVTIHRADTSDAAGLRALALRLDELSVLEADCDSYGAFPPTARAVAAASRLMIEAVTVTGELPDAVMPFPSGGLQVIWKRGAHELQVNVGPDGCLGNLEIQRDPGEPEMREAESVSLIDIVARVDCTTDVPTLPDE
jgi:hypothetical protein